MPSAKIFPNIISFNAAIASCEKGHQWLRALHFLCRGSLRPDVISFSSALSACEGQWRWALEVYGRMTEMDVISCNAAGPRIGMFEGSGHKSGEVSVEQCKKHFFYLAKKVGGFLDIL